MINYTIAIRIVRLYGSRQKQWSGMFSTSFMAFEFFIYSNKYYLSLSLNLVYLRGTWKALIRKYSEEIKYIQTERTHNLVNHGFCFFFLQYQRMATNKLKDSNGIRLYWRTECGTCKVTGVFILIEPVLLKNKKILEARIRQYGK